MTTPLLPAWLAPNPRLDRDLAFGRDQQFVVNPNGIPELLAELGQCPAHKVTPLHRLPALAERLGVGEVRVKDESQRFGFGAFKALGGVLAVYNVLSGAVGDAYHSSPTFADVMAGKHREVTAKYIFTTASSGNHGRSVAAGAKLFGNRCVIFLPRFTSADKEAAIRARGAEVIRVDGDYDTAVAECRRQAEAKGWTIISDTSWEGYDAIPRSVMRGYTVLVEEVVRQWPDAPTHVFVQAGVGGLAAAVIGYLWAVLPQRPVFIVVEPVSADCWFQSNLAGKPTLASGNADTAMGGLACREISPVTWPVIGLAADWFMTIEEDEVLPARRLFARPLGDDPAIVSGPSGCAGLAGLTRICTEAAAFEALGLDRNARVLLINSEGDLGEPLSD
ncbi:MAG: diaminopropionate ammonia-lyase [Reyranella sp.]|uniref:diaminopropionate ammonia-lyase n=1 Tax=Reyranella sp. TaxID=1929291 RepID=UPI00122ACD65|nr:diaminopropionate ammonia-lyase [Reyranella sp.]TAJ41441.1 MAG: diaminopropionate ammonia-lyase [Reyranella sp.]